MTDMHVTFSRGKCCIILLLIISYLLAGLVLLTSVTVPHVPKSSGTTRHAYSGGGVRNFGGTAMVRGFRRPRMVLCQPLRFLPGFDRPTIALVSFPGSGNTWLRYMLQQATGVNTGSVYKDYGLLRNGFPGECVANSSVSVVKTHERGPFAFQGYHKAVLLVRDPSEAIQAEFNRQGGGHIGFAPPHQYKLRKGRLWGKFVEEQIIKWKKTNLDWLFNFKGPILVIFYEDLVNELEPNLRELIHFLELKIKESYLKCALKRREGIYRRKKRLLTLDPFTAQMKAMIGAVKEEVYSRLHFYIQNRKSVLP